MAGDGGGFDRKEFIGLQANWTAAFASFGAAIILVVLSKSQLATNEYWAVLLQTVAIPLLLSCSLVARAMACGQKVKGIGAAQLSIGMVIGCILSLASFAALLISIGVIPSVIFVVSTMLFLYIALSSFQSQDEASARSD